MPFDQTFPVSRRWTGQWIWHPQAPAKNAYVLFRHEFELDRSGGARLCISADTRYRAWLNGKLLGDGPPQSQPFYQYYDERSLDGLARVGTNCLAVLVYHQGVQPNTQGGLLAEVLNANGETVCASGKDWRTAVGHAWRTDTEFFKMNKLGPYQEHFDASALPRDWLDAGFEAGAWQAPMVRESRNCTRPPVVMPWCRLVPRDIAFLEESPTYATAVVCAEECVDLANRIRAEDLSLSLSQVGRPVEWATLALPEKLLEPGGEAILACSTRHRDGVTDGRYDPCLTLDFGRILTGYAEVEVEAPAGARLEIGYAERLVDGRFNNTLECYFADSVTCAAGRTYFRPLLWRAFRYLRFRVKYAEEPVRVRFLRAAEVRYPYQPLGDFRGNPRLEAIFEICRRTVELCSIEALMDTPQREQAQWLGDVAAVTVPAIYACFGDAALPGKFLRQAAVNTQPTGLISNVSNIVSSTWYGDIPDYSLWWVMALWKHYLYTGDARYLHECYPEMQRVVRVHLERLNADGLLEDMFGWVFIDWAAVDRRGLCAALNAIFAGACDAAAKVAAFKGDTWAVERYQTAASGVRAAFAQTFLDPLTGLVTDCVEHGERSAKISEHANAAAIAFDCVDAAVATRIVEQLFESAKPGVTEAQPFFMVVVLDALRKAGRTDLALRLIDERWGKRMLDRGLSSCAEEWYINGSWRSGDWHGFMRTQSHAWSACPADFLITRLAGLEILTPGCAFLAATPYAADFAYAVVYPTPRGQVHLAWDGTSARVNTPRDVRLELRAAH